MDSNWNKFIKATKDRQPVGFLVDTVKKITLTKGRVLDLGCGAGVDAKYLVKNGFKVEAIDNNKKSIEQAKILCKGLNIKITQCDIVNYEIQSNFYQLIISWNVISFLKKSDARKVLNDIQSGLRDDGFFVFGFLGMEDEWNNKNHSDMSFWTIEELKDILSDMKFIRILEIKEKKPSATGEMKFWHQIQGIAQYKSR